MASSFGATDNSWEFRLAKALRIFLIEPCGLCAVIHFLIFFLYAFFHKKFSFFGILTFKRINQQPSELSAIKNIPIFVYFMNVIMFVRCREDYFCINV